MKNIFTKKNILKLADLRITTLNLLILFILTLVGTFYQYNYGLYAAQKEFFYSWFFMIYGIIPFFGAKTVLTVLFINLLAATLRYSYRSSKIGILIIHYGIIFLIISSFYIHYFSKEAITILEEGQTVDYSLDYFESELAVYQEEGPTQHIASYDFNSIERNKKFFIKKFNLEITPIYIYPHATPTPFKEEVENVNGITSLTFSALPLAREETLPGGVFEIYVPQQNIRKKILLWEGGLKPFPLRVGDKTYFLKIQRKRYPLPFKITLKDFKKEEYGGTAVPKSFQSKVVYEQANKTYPILISMNEPFRNNGYTLFQSSFSVDEANNEKSFLATVKNRGYYLPYVASLIISFGLIVHFLVMLFKRLKIRR